MRPLLALALAAGPLLASAQTAGDLVTSPTSINGAQCASGSDATLGLSWTIELASGESFVTTGEYRVFAASKDFGAASPYCYTQDDSGAGAFAAELTTVPATVPATSQSVSSVQVKTADVTAAVNQDCTVDVTAIHLCVLWYPTVGGATPKGWAKGTVALKVEAPEPPSVTGVTPGENALYVKVAETAGSVETAEVQVRVEEEGGGGVEESDWTAYAGSPVEIRVEGLQNGVGYTVTARARSAEENVSDWSACYGATETDPTCTAVAPVPVMDGWEYYDLLGGRDDGGCGTGGAGLLALLGAAGLLRLRRRA